MNVRKFALVMALVAISSSSVFAQTDFFWSTFNLDEGASNGDVNVELSNGDTSSLYLYYTTNGPADSDMSVGAFLDVATSMNGVIQFTRAETFDFGIAVGGVPIDNRWLDDMGGGGSAGETGTLSDDFIDEWNAFTVTGGQGILEANAGPVFEDLGYDAGADAFLFGVVDFTVIGNDGDSVSLNTVAGDGMIVNGSDVIPATFGNATITIGGGGPVVPEPTTAGLLAIGLVGLVARRRR